MENYESFESEIHNEAPQETENNNTRASKSIVMYLHDVVCLLCAIVLVFVLCFRIVIVSGSSMKNTLVDGDYLLLLSNVFYRNPKAGDIIVASKKSFDSGAPIVKRVIAVEGQQVDINFETGDVFVDGQLIEEKYISTPNVPGSGIEYPVTVEKGCLFVMGDNRSWSKDSRHSDVGLIDCREVLGKAIFLFLPGTDLGSTSRDFSRIGGLN